MENIHVKKQEEIHFYTTFYALNKYENKYRTQTSQRKTTCKKEEIFKKTCFKYFEPKTIRGIRKNKNKKNWKILEN